MHRHDAIYDLGVLGTGVRVPRVLVLRAQRTAIFPDRAEFSGGEPFADPSARGYAA